MGHLKCHVANFTNENWKDALQTCPKGVEFLCFLILDQEKIKVTFNEVMIIMGKTMNGDKIFLAWGTCTPSINVIQCILGQFKREHKRCMYPFYFLIRRYHHMIGGDWLINRKYLM